MLPHPTPSMEPPFFMQASMETRRSHQWVRYSPTHFIPQPFLTQPTSSFFLPKVSKNIVFFFISLCNRLKTRKRGLKLKRATNGLISRWLIWPSS